MAQLTCEHLWLGYEGRPVLEDLSFSVQAGDYLCIVGENGSGKTTLMRTILGLQKPMRGNIRFGDGLREGGIGYLPQQTNVQKDMMPQYRDGQSWQVSTATPIQPSSRSRELRQAAKSSARRVISA